MRNSWFSGLPLLGFLDLLSDSKIKYDPNWTFDFQFLKDSFQQFHVVFILNEESFKLKGCEEEFFILQAKLILDSLPHKELPT